MKTKAIAVNTFKEAARNKVFYLLIAIGIFFALGSRVVSMLTIGDEIKVVKEFGLAAIKFFCVLIAVFTGINLVYKEIDKRTIYNILSKPISRPTFIIGKFFGLALTLLTALAAMAVIFFVFMFILSGKFDAPILLYFAMLYMELLIITAISLMFSSFSTPILSSIFTIVIYLVGQVLWTFNLFKEYLKTSLEKGVSYFFYYILPNLDKFDIRETVVMGESPDATYILYSLLYALAYISAILVVAILVFNRKEFQ